MRRTALLLALVLTAALSLTACSSDNPSSFQELIYGSWQAVGSPTTFVDITFTQSNSPLVGTYTATVLTQGDPDDPDSIMETEEQGTIGIAGSVLYITRPGFGQLQWPFSIDGNDLTLTTNLGTEVYRK